MRAPETDEWREDAITWVAYTMNAIAEGVWTPEDTDDGDVTRAIARKLVDQVEKSMAKFEAEERPRRIGA